MAESFFAPDEQTGGGVTNSQYFCALISVERRDPVFAYSDAADADGVGRAAFVEPGTPPRRPKHTKPHGVHATGSSWRTRPEISLPA
jgi:hypothetical protein